MEKLLYTRTEAAKMLSISTDTLDRLCKKDEIEYMRIGSRVMFRPEALVNFASAHNIYKTV